MTLEVHNTMSLCVCKEYGTILLEIIEAPTVWFGVLGCKVQGLDGV